MSGLPFAKVQSLGNDFVLVHYDDVAGMDLSTLALDLCRRHFSVGADGLLVLGRDGGQLTLRMFNPDGTEDFCGNGLRCAAWYAHENGWIGNETTIHHHGRDVAVRIDAEGHVETTLGTASFAPADIPLEGRELFEGPLPVGGETLTVSALSTGTAHTVIFVDELPEDERFFHLSPLIEHHPWFAERTSVMWAKIEGPDRIRLRIWERGAGETLGCGTGSAATAAAYLRREGRGGKVTVVNPGGTVTMQMASWDAPIVAIGKAQTVYRASAVVEALQPA